MKIMHEIKGIKHYKMTINFYIKLTRSLGKGVYSPSLKKTIKTNSYKVHNVSIVLN